MTDEEVIELCSTVQCKVDMTRENLCKKMEKSWPKEAFKKPTFEDLDPKEKRYIYRSMGIKGVMLFNKYIDEEKLKKRQKNSSNRACALFYEERFQRIRFQHVYALRGTTSNEANAENNTVNKSVSGSENDLANDSDNQSVNQSGNDSDNESVNQSVNQSGNGSDKDLVNKSVISLMNVSNDEMVNKSVNSSLDLNLSGQTVIESQNYRQKQNQEKQMEIEDVPNYNAMDDEMLSQKSSNEKTNNSERESPIDPSFAGSFADIENRRDLDNDMERFLDDGMQSNSSSGDDAENNDQPKSRCNTPDFSSDELAEDAVSSSGRDEGIVGTEVDSLDFNTEIMENVGTSTQQ